ncbi:MAG TPA: HDOD domain-containing protein [Thiobacillaceae bacterium]|nr:HDOD domain-containing protein [Thiobacillaceae bacterium]HNF89813.1 HDOD domain-containing protein [Thiobacillaceae bacterium]HNH90062.1 HDOD domain-containing protein [Thiobacillaceae bacterium]HNI08147.1 HDOD domain-containing protein [Thiobacillaceae bacterium]
MAGHQEFKDPKLGMAVRIPSPPPLVDDLRTLLDDPEASIENIATLVQKDAGVTASLYKILSKPIYGLRRPPETIAQAVNLVGLRTLANLISGLSIQAAIYGETPFFPWFWERANEIAAYAAAIAQRQRTVCNVFPEHAQLAALFVDCGVPILVQHIKEYEHSFIGVSGYKWPHVPDEDKRLNTDHAVVGYLAAKHWHLPVYVCEAIRWHHEPINVNDQAATMVAILQTAIHIYNVYAMKDDHDWPEYADKALEEVGIARDGLKEFEEDIHERAHGH